MRTVDTSIKSKFQSGQLIMFTLLKMTIDGTDYTYTDCDVPIHSTNTYSPRGIDLKGITYSDNQVVDKAELALDNLDDALTTVFVGGTPQGSDVYLYLVIMTTGDDNYITMQSEAITMQGETITVQGGGGYTIVASPLLVFQGEIDKWGFAEGTIDITVANIFNRWKRKTQARQNPSCRWKVFGGTECGYSGSESWCDRTYSKCSALGNTANFGGERWLASIVDKTIWWGRTPS